MAAHTSTRWIAVLTLLMVQLQVKGGYIGVNYGLLGDNLPAPKDAVNLILKTEIEMVRIFEPNLQVLNALRGVELDVCVGVKNEDLLTIAASEQGALQWINTYIIPYNDVNVGWITVGNEVIPGPNAQYLLPALQNLKNGLDAAGFGGKILLTTVISTAVLGTSYPPSQGAFLPEIIDTMNAIVTFVNNIGAPVMVNVYPYYALVSDPEHISLDYALFTSQSPVVKDGDLEYYNLFDAIFDAFLSAFQKGVGSTNVDLMVAETGWPSAGGNYATVANAQTYNNNLKNHIKKQGTPKRPTVLLDAFIFALFNEDQKSPGAEQNFGNFYPNMSPVYPLW